MENFTLTGANGWQKLSTLLGADATFSGKYLWAVFIIRNTSANTMIIKSLPGSTAPAADSGINLTAVSGTAPGIGIDAGENRAIDGQAIWIKCSAGSTTFDLTFIKQTGV